MNKAIVLLLFTILSAACVGPAQTSALESPLVPDANPALMHTTWQLEEVAYHDASIEIDALDETYFVFEAGGTLYIAHACGGGQYRILSLGEQEYLLRGRITRAADCSDRVAEQLEQMVDVLHTTQRYMLEEDRLVLLGDHAQVVLHEAAPLRPFAAQVDPALLESSWRLLDVTHDDEAVEFGAIEPFWLSFSTSNEDGFLNFGSATCAGGAFRLIPLGEHRYRLVHGEVLPEDCGEQKNAQFDNVVNALSLTIAYELRGDKLFLTGENVHLVLEPENPAE